jgi:hypothetical protein
MAGTNGAQLEGYRPDMDGPAHETTYNRFTHFTVVTALFVICIVVGLAVGGVKHAWMSAVVMIVLAHVAAAIGLFSQSMAWRPAGLVLGILLLMLLFY